MLFQSLSGNLPFCGTTAANMANTDTAGEVILAVTGRLKS
jgi:hypothetical protein